VRIQPTVFDTILSNVPRLANNATSGARYTYNFNFNEMSGVQLSSRASNAASGDSNLGLTTVDADAVLNLTPTYRIVSCTFAGVGNAERFVTITQL
jgi:hypothetical protein